MRSAALAVFTLVTIGQIGFAHGQVLDRRIRTQHETSISALDRGQMQDEVARAANDRMINGRELLEGETASWAGSIHLDGKFRCGATFVSPFRLEGNWDGKIVFKPEESNPTWLITAGHCFAESEESEIDPEIYQIGSGSSDLVGQLSNALRPLLIIRHPQFRKADLANDIALVRVEQPTGGNRLHRRSISIVDSDAHARLTQPYSRVSVYGWGEFSVFASGESRSILKVEMPVVDAETCDRAHSESSNQHVRRANRQNALCLGFSTGGTGICNGDSGSGGIFAPSFQEDRRDGHNILIAVASWSPICGVEGGFDGLANPSQMGM